MGFSKIAKPIKVRSFSHSNWLNSLICWRF